MLDASQLRNILHYNPETGEFRWLVRPAQRIQVGDNAGCLCKTHGYVDIRIDNRLYKAHVLAWLYAHGEWPGRFIDHIDQNRSNNRLANLRLATKAQNAINSKIRRDNTSGLKGVVWDKTRGLWKAQLGSKNGMRFIGRFPTKDQAHAAYCEAAQREFGEFARVA